MRKQFGDLSREQWDFLSILDAFGEPVSIEIAGALSPISPGQFLELIGQNNKIRYIYEPINDHYSIVPEIASQLEAQISKLNNQQRLNEIVDKLDNDKLMGRVSPPVIEKLFAKLDKIHISAEIEINLAQTALEKKDEQTAFNFLKSAVCRLCPIAESLDARHLFIRTVIELIPLWLSSGEPITELIYYMKKALKITNTIGDKRSHAIINLALSEYYELVGQDEEMWNAFTLGYQGVKDLGDNDILRRTAPSLGTNLFLQGLYKEAEPYFQRSLPLFSSNISDESALNHIMRNIYPYGMCLLSQGKFYEAFGYLYLCYRDGKERSKNDPSLFAKHMLGIALLILKQIQPAKDIIENAVKEATNTKDNIILYLLYFSLSYSYFLEGHFEKARELIVKTSEIGEKLGTFRFPMASYIIEMLFEMNQLGYTFDARFNYKEQVERILKGKNVNLKGVVLRLEAVAMSKANEKTSQINDYLKASEKYLEKSGDPIQLGKTLLERARFNLKKGDEKNAGQLVKKAYRQFGGYASVFFPQDLKHLLNVRELSDNTEHSWKTRYQNSIDAYDLISEVDNIDDVRFRMLRSICNMLKAERAGLFWFDKQKDPEKMDHFILHNITPAEMISTEFKSSKALIRDALKTKNPCLERVNKKPGPQNPFPIRSMFCLSGTTAKQLTWILYLDNIFLEDHYDKVDPVLIDKLINQAFCLTEQPLRSDRIKPTRHTMDFEDTVQTIRSDDEMHFQNPIMVELISEVDKVAQTDSSILIYGETGTGKEVLAHRIHQMSPRHKNPFIVVDLTSIPENLMESELFGFEKGSFTGATERKRGRLEMVHQGTLFLDEIGEIPPSFQVKLLRLLQEKKFVRIGSTQPVFVDFRLIAATNRNLEEEVAAGRFRQDLYYRLSVMPVKLPPLRERQNDILLLARYFLDKYASKHKKTDLRLIPEDEAWLLTYRWPGNIRELKSIIERSVILSLNGMLNLSKINSLSEPLEQLNLPRESLLNSNGKHLLPIEDFPTLEEMQRRYIKIVLNKTKGIITGPSGAVKILGMKPSSLYSRMKKLGIR